MTEEEFTALRQKNEQMLTIVMKACENLREERGHTQPQLNEDIAFKMLSLVTKAIGSNLSVGPDRSFVKENTASGVDVKAGGKYENVMTEEEFTAFRQRNEQMLTIVMKACENLCEKRGHTRLQLNEDSAFKMCRLVTKALGSDLSVGPDRSLVKESPASGVSVKARKDSEKS